MPTLLLPPQITPDIDAMLAAAQAALRVDGWRAPAGLNGRDVVLYGEPLFAYLVALLQAPFDWLPCQSATASVR